VVPEVRSQICRVPFQHVAAKSHGAMMRKKVKKRESERGEGAAKECRVLTHPRDCFRASLKTHVLEDVAVLPSRS